MKTTIKLHCPKCGHVMRIPLYRSATYIDLKTCKGCAVQWVVKAEVLKAGSDMAIHEVTWTRQSGVAA